MGRKETPKIQEVVLEAGNIYKTLNWGDVVIVKYKGNKIVVVRFLNTRNTKVTQKHQIEKGLIEDTKEKERLSEVKKKELLRKKAADEKNKLLLKQKIKRLKEKHVKELLVLEENYKLSVTKMKERHKNELRAMSK